MSKIESLATVVVIAILVAVLATAFNLVDVAQLLQVGVR
jgi:hypothetical protein